jgi:uncharacterized protein (TIGR03382 family)
MMKLALPIATALGLLASTAHADPCVWVTKNQAVNASRWLGSTFGEKYLQYCESCGDIYPTETVVKAVSFAWGAGQKEFFEVKVNNEVIALGTSYVKVDSNGDGTLDNFRNLAELVGCDPGIPTGHFDLSSFEPKNDENDEDFTDTTVSDSGGCSATTGGSTGMLVFASVALLAVGGRRRRQRA